MNDNTSTPLTALLTDPIHTIFGNPPSTLLMLLVGAVVVFFIAKEL